MYIKSINKDKYKIAKIPKFKMCDAKYPSIFRYTSKDFNIIGGPITRDFNKIGELVTGGHRSHCNN